MTDSQAKLFFKKVALQDQAFLEEKLRRFPQEVVGYSFPILYMWSAIYHYEWALCLDGTILISCKSPADGKRHFLQPVGDFGPDSQSQLRALIRKADYPVRIFGVGADFFLRHPDFITGFEIENDPGTANYLYRATDLAELPGKFYAKKRNLIAQAARVYAWDVHPLTGADIPACLEILKRMEENNTDGEHPAMQGDEAPVLMTALADYTRLGLQGVLLRVAGEPAAFSIYDRTTPDMAAIHFEKADRRFKGLYQVINAETARVIAAAGIPFVNREEDLGLPGLRQAKSSYGPVRHIASCMLVSKPSAGQAVPEVAESVSERNKGTA